MEALLFASNACCWPLYRCTCYIPKPFGHTTLCLSLLSCLQGIQKKGGWLLSIPLWIVLDPPPQICTGILQRLLCFPPKLRIWKRRVRCQSQHIALASCTDLVRQSTSNHSADSFRDVGHGAAF